MDINPEYDCRNYYAKKHFIEGNILEVKKFLDPIDNVSILNTYLQMCVYNIEVEDAYEIFESGKNLSNDGTYYLMSLICIFDGDYILAHDYLEKANKGNKDIPLHIMMEGVILYWELLPSNMIYGDSLLPSLYANSMLLLNYEAKQQMKEIVSLYKKAYELAQVSDNTELQKQILTVWLNTLSISDEYREDGCKIAYKLMEFDEYQCQAVIYFSIIGKEILLKKDFEPTEIVQKKGTNIESMISCVYLYMCKKDKQSAYKRLKEYRFKFEEMHMMEHWFELAVRCCDDSDELLKIHESLDDFNMDMATKSRINGMILEARGENDQLISHALSLYQQTNQEIDLLNLLNSYEKKEDWKNAEYYCNEWFEKYHNDMANTKMVRYLALQNKQEECLDKISDLRKSGKEECLTNEVLFYEVQAFKITGKYNDAIEHGEKLWSKVVSAKVLFLLVECYYLNVQEVEAIYKLREGMKKGINSVEVYQMYAEYNKRININETEKYVNKALMRSDNDSNVMMWAMNLLYSIGKSSRASELLVKLQALDKLDNFRTLTFKEAKEWIDKLEEESEKRYEMYMKCQCPYHIFFDQSGTASYTLYCHQLWSSNINSEVRKQLLLTSFGGHNASAEELKKSLGATAIIDFSSLVHLKHFDLLEDIKTCWKQIVISGNISNIIADEQNKCSPNQPDMLLEKKRMLETWKRRSLHYIELPSQNDLEQWMETGINPSDIVPYKLAESNDLILVSDNFISDLLEESYKITKEMRKGVISTYELLSILERRRDISSEFKNKYIGDKSIREQSELFDSIVNHSGKLSILVDENFMREIFEMDGAAIISQKCNLYVLKNIFLSTETEMKNVEIANKAFGFLNDLKADIQDGQESGFICYYGFYRDDNKRENGILTNDLLDLFHYASANNQVFLCDDRWMNSYNNFGECFIYSVVDIVELLHNQKYISDEKYIKIITQMFIEGYAYIVPPLEYVRLLLEQVIDGSDIRQEIPEELNVMCNYLIYITASKSCLGNEMIHQDVLPESAGYMYNLQRVLIKLMKYVWCAERGELWKRQVSDWLLANYSVFTYQSVMNENDVNNNQKYYELELSNFLFSGFCEIPGSSYRKEYYNWLFNWLSQNSQWKNGLEEKLIKALADIISEVYRHEKGDLYKDIGIGMLVLSVTDDMPEYYKNLIRRNTSIARIIENFEDNFIYLGVKDFIYRDHFNQWLEDVMKQGINSSIIRTNETTKRNYTITFVADVLFHQGFKVEYVDDNENEKIHYFRIDQAMILCQDTMLRTKGLFALNDFVSEQDMREYQRNLKRKNWGDVVENIILGMKSSEKYIIDILQYMLENKTRLFSVEDLFPDKTDLFERILENNTEDSVCQKVNHWLEDSDKNCISIFTQLLIYIYNYFRKSEIFNIFSEVDCLLVANYFADMVLTQMIQINGTEKLKYTLEDLSKKLIQLNDSMGFLENFKNNVITQEEKTGWEQDASVFFSSDNVQQASSSEIVEICEKLYYIEGDSVHQYLSRIREWIIEQWKTAGVNGEQERLRIMEHYATIANLENPNQIVDGYLELWEEILTQEIHIEISKDSIYLLRRFITSFKFDEGIRMRKIIEKICLQNKF